MNKSIHSNMNSEALQMSQRSAATVLKCSTARQFFSKNNLDHPSIEENHQLKQQLAHLKSVQKQSQGLDVSSSTNVNEETRAIRTQLEQYKTFVEEEKQKFLGLQSTLDQQIEQVKSEMNEQFSKTHGSVGFSIKSENVEDVR